MIYQFLTGPGRRYRTHLHRVLATLCELTMLLFLPAEMLWAPCASRSGTRLNFATQGIVAFEGAVDFLPKWLWMVVGVLDSAFFEGLTAASVLARRGAHPLRSAELTNTHYL